MNSFVQSLWGGGGSNSTLTVIGKSQKVDPAEVPFPVELNKYGILCGDVMERVISRGNVFYHLDLFSRAGRGGL